jgi:hypothetical protein
MILDFPLNPTIGQIFTGENNVTYTWDGVKWVGKGSLNTATAYQISPATIGATTVQNANASSHGLLLGELIIYNSTLPLSEITAVETTLKKQVAWN